MNRPQGHKLRLGRYSQDGQVYLVTSVTYRREKIFSDLYLGRVLIQTMRHHCRLDHAESLAFVIMPDHFHWLFALHQTTLSRLIGSVKGYSARRIREFLEERGEPVSPRHPIWQEGYHDHALRREEDLLQTARYVVANPLRAGLTDSIGDYALWDAAWL